MPAGGRPLHGSGQAAKVVLDQALEVLNLSKPALILVLLPQSAKGIRQETKHWGDVVKVSVCHPVHIFLSLINTVKV